MFESETSEKQNSHFQKKFYVRPGQELYVFHVFNFCEKSAESETRPVRVEGVMYQEFSVMRYTLCVVGEVVRG